MSLMGTSVGLTLSFVSQALALSMVAGLVGAIFFALIGDMSKKIALMLISLIAMALSLWGLDSDLTELRYLVALCIFAFFWSIASARLSAAISDVDHSGQYISAAQTVLGLAYILGPILASNLVQDAGYTKVIMMGTVLFGLCFIFLLPLARFKTT
jgi:predicted MFS family arabinose efflux permease